MYRDRGGPRSFGTLIRIFATILLLISGCLATGVVPAWGQEELNRKAKFKVAPAYPDLARRMNITGVVKLQVTVAANGTVKSARLVGGHPVLANAALDAIKKWRFETGPDETTGIVDFHFSPNQ
ncbi:MAG: energy transducer TonB [Terriglobales bacterium]|jgi:TonB family protein